jgi:hypothetical protein
MIIINLLFTIIFTNQIVTPEMWIIGLSLDALDMIVGYEIIRRIKK